MAKTSLSTHIPATRRLTTGAVQSFLWLLWRRHRAELGVMVGLMVAVWLLGCVQTMAAFGVAMLLRLVLVGTWMFYIGRLANGDSDWVGEGSNRNGSAYPLFMLTAPLSDRSLLIIPILFGIASTAVLFVMAILLTVPKPDLRAGLAFGGFIAALTVSTQILAWTRTAGRYTKIILAGCLLLSGTAASFSYADNHLGLGVYVFAYSAVAILFLAAFSPGFSKSRHGHSRPSRSIWEANLTPSRKPSKAWPRFNSPSHSLVWTNWRRQGLSLPILTTIWCLAYLALQIPHQVQLRDYAAQQEHLAFMVGRDLVTLNQLPDWPWDNLTPLVVLVICSALVIGMVPRKVDIYGADLTLQPFLATKPISGLNFILTQIRVSLRSSLLSTAILAGTIEIAVHFWDVPLDFRWFSIGDHLVGPWDAMSGLRGAFYPIVPIGFWLSMLFLCIWNAQTFMNAVELSGRRILPYVPLMVPFVLLVLTLIANGSGPEFGRQIYGFLCILSAAKIGLVLASGFRLRKRRAIAGSDLLVMAFGWMICVGVFALYFAAYFPKHGELDYSVPTGILLIPISRFFIAPLMFEWNRHR
jgi:hypothetical protein